MSASLYTEAESSLFRRMIRIFTSPTARVTDCQPLSTVVDSGSSKTADGRGNRGSRPGPPGAPTNRREPREASLRTDERPSGPACFYAAEDCTMNDEALQIREVGAGRTPATTSKRCAYSGLGHRLAAIVRPLKAIRKNLGLTRVR